MIPISLVSRSPSVIPKSICTILVANSNDKSNLPPPPPVSSKSAITNITKNDNNNDVEDSNEISEDDPSAIVTKEIIEFVEALLSRGYLTPTHSYLLKKLLSSNSTLLFAAYSVAISANDSEYFAEICKDMALSLQSEQGRMACEAQDEVLQVSDQLYINTRISENQLLYLRHLVLIRDEDVATIYDQFQEHQSVPTLAKALYDLCNTHPYQHAKVYPIDSDNLIEADSSSFASIGAFSAGVTQNLKGVVSLMVKNRQVNNTEAHVLLEMIEKGNDYVLAAYELFDADNNIEELQDTLYRCVKLEIRKRKVDIQENELNRLTKYDKLSNQYDEEENADDEDDRDDEDEDEDDDEEEEDDEDDDDEEDNDDDDDDFDGEFTLEHISLESILESLGVTNIWERSVPDKFVKAMFIAVIRKQLDIYQAKALCDLYHANYDLVKAAWEVFTVQEDNDDLIDTLKRVVRDLSLDDDDIDESDREGDEDEVVPVPAAVSKSVSSSTVASSISNPKASTTTNTSAPSSSSSSSSSAVAAAEAMQERKREALAAVSAAKKDLLKHSLEMMVKQGITTGQAASGLFSRYLRGDILCEAAIDAYASDRNVTEFLDTLQILANHSEEDLAEMMRDVSSSPSAATKTSDVPTSSSSSSSTTTTAATASSMNPITTSSSSTTTSTTTASNHNNSTPSSLRTIELQLNAIINELSRNGMISGDISNVLSQLVVDHDSRILLAYKEYVENQQGANLIDKLLKIATNVLKEEAGSISKAYGISSSNSNNKSNNSTNRTNIDKYDTADDDKIINTSDSLLNAEDKKTVIDILSKANAISTQQAKYLNSLIDCGNPTISKVFRSYEIDKDVYRLIDALKVVENYSKESSTTEQADDEDNGEDNDEDEDGYNDKFDKDDAVSIESKFLQIIQDMDLSHLETAALRLAIARNDDSIRNAIEQFRSDTNENRLKTTLKEVALSVIKDTLNDVDDDADDDDDDDNPVKDRDYDGEYGVEDEEEDDEV